MNDTARRTLVGIAFSAAVVAACALVTRPDLRRVAFLSGWLLLVPLVLGALAWWFAGSGRAELLRRARLEPWLAAVLVPLYLVHGGLGLPVGWTETTLALLLVALLASSARGAWLVRRSAAQPTTEALALWARLHVALAFALTSLGVFHGVLVHGHGVLAHFLLHGAPE